MSAKPKYKSVAVWIPMDPVTEKRRTNVQTGSQRIEKQRLFGGTKVVDEPVYEMREVDEIVSRSDTHVDLAEFTNRLDEVCQELETDGYEILFVNPVIGGRYKWDKFVGQEISQVPNPRTMLVRHDQVHPYAYAYGYGYGITEGFVITARLRT